MDHNLLPYQSTVFARDATCFLIYQDVKTKASNLGKQFSDKYVNSTPYKKRKRRTV